MASLIVSRGPMLAWSPALFFAIATSVGWSLFDLSRRFLARTVSAWALIFWVTLPALPLLAAWGAGVGQWRLEPGYAVPGLTSAALNVVANFAFFRAIQLSPLSLTLPMLSLTPVFTSLLGAAVLDEPLVPRAGAGIALVVAGAVILATSSAPGRARLRFEIGSLVMGFVALCWSATLLLDKLALAHADPPVHALVLNAVTALGGLVALAALRRLGDLGAIRGHLGMLALAVAIGAAAVATQLLAIQHAPIGLVETLKRAIGGVLAVLWGRAFFGEAVTARKVVSVVLLGIGVAMILL